MESPGRINGQSLRVISYTYSSGAEAPKVPNTLCVRSIEFTLAGDIVVGEGFASACASDHTDFDDHRAREIVVEKTRCDEVIAMLGRPAARAVYPIAREKGDLFLAYRFAYPKRPLLQLNIYQKVLAIGCSADGLVREVEFMERAANREGTLAPTRLRAKGGAMKPPGASRLIVSVVVAAALSAGAAGTGFVRPPADAVRLGETTRAQIVERFGKPRLERQFRLNGVTLWSAEYFVASDAEAPKVPETRCMRWMIFFLADDTVVGDGFVSACASDHTDFDERKVGDIVKGKTRCDDVTAMLGRPGMRGIYPAGVKPGELNLGYVFRYEAGAGRQANSYLKDLEVLCDPQGVVREVTFEETGGR